jgi:hypothetical protein
MPDGEEARILSDAEGRIGLEQHVDVRDAILIVRRRRRAKAEARVERLELLLRRDPDRLPRPCVRAARAIPSAISTRPNPMPRCGCSVNTLPIDGSANLRPGSSTRR